MNISSNFGLSANLINGINLILKKYPEIECAKIFGSRAKGNYRNNSDIDITIFGENIDDILVGRLQLELNDLDTIYEFDLKNYHSISNNKLKQHIDEVGKLLFSNSTT